jgi:hypothetical protein
LQKNNAFTTKGRDLLQLGKLEMRVNVFRGKHICIPGLFLSLLLFATNASASLLGVTISGCTDAAFPGVVTTDPNQCDPRSAGFNTTAVVGDGNEFQIDWSRRVNFTGDTVSLIYRSSHNSPSADLFVFTDLIWSDPTQVITGLELLTTNLINVTTAFDPNAIGLLVNSPLASSTDTVVTYKILTSQVPIPAAVWLFGSALAGLGWMRRRKTV